MQVVERIVVGAVVAAACLGLTIARPARAAAASDTRKVAVFPIDGEKGDRLRLALLDELSRHPELEIIGHRDVEVSAKRFALDIRESRTRRRLAEELAITAWFEGQVDGSRLRISVHDAQGRRLGQLTVDAPPGEAQAAAVRERVWEVLGRYVSDKALREHVLSLHRKAAEQKLAARQQELERQQGLAAKRAERLRDYLATLKREALAKLERRNKQHVRLQELALNRRRAAEREREEQAQAEAAEQRRMALEQQRAAAMPVAPPTAAPVATYGPAGYGNAGYDNSGYGGGAPAAGYGGAQAGGADAAPEISPETRAWLSKRAAATGSSPAAGYAPAYTTPTPAPTAAPAAPAPSGGGCPDNVSEATCQWLMSRGGQ